MINKIDDNSFILSTQNTSYVFNILETGHLEHLYYGSLIHADDFSFLVEKHEFCGGNLNSYDESHPNINLEDISLEMSSYGKGDIRDSFVEIVYEDGSSTSDFIYKSSVISSEKPNLGKLPSSYSQEDDYEHLSVILEERTSKVTLELHYLVYSKTDVITRYSILKNTSDKPIQLVRLMSNQIDFFTGDFDLTSFHGNWTNEMNKHVVSVQGARVVVSSYAGFSSSRSNPFTMLHDRNANEDYGKVYGFNLIYSGNHYTSAEKTGLGHTRLISGINPENFCNILLPGDEFISPEAIMSFSNKGFTGLSHNMHSFIREHIIRGSWKKKSRPILLNSWEAAYFKINENKLYDLAKAAKDVGIELFVMDDGWFGSRNDDKTSLGDWTVNTDKLPHGLDGICNKINKLGLDFGIWVEPEMINEDSNLYRAHPDWAVKIPGRDHTLGRNQMILDLCNPKVRKYIVDSMSEVFSSANISYVKWDMNRIFSDYFSPSLPAERQGEMAHRYILGLYEIMGELTNKFPDILFEGCAAGGNRFDLGILSFFPQIWGSDDTDAMARAEIETGYSYGYPLSTVSAHVSDVPNHQTLRKTSLDTRFAIASIGVLGYECNLCDMSSDEKKEIAAQVDLYKKWRDVLFEGDIYRDHTDNEFRFTVVSPDQKKAVGIVMKEKVLPNHPHMEFKPKGLNPDSRYHFYNLPKKYNIKDFGGLINTVAPFHIKQDGKIHDLVSDFVKMDGEVADYTVSGDALMNAGVKLHQSYVGTGYNDKTRYMSDYGCRIYFMEEV